MTECHIRSGRVIKPKKFGDDVNGTPDSAASKAADKIIEEPRKVWVKLKSSGDLVEINLDRDKPDRSVHTLKYIIVQISHEILFPLHQNDAIFALIKLFFLKTQSMEYKQ